MAEMRFTLTAVSHGQVIMITWEDGKLLTDERTKDAINYFAIGLHLHDKVLGIAPNYAYEPEQYIKNPIAFIQMYRLMFPGLDYALTGDDPESYKNDPPGAIY